MCITSTRKDRANEHKRQNKPRTTFLVANGRNTEVESQVNYLVGKDASKDNVMLAESEDEK